MKNGLNKFKISHVKPESQNFFEGASLSKKKLFELIDVVRNTTSAKSITNAQDYEPQNISTLSRLSIGLATEQNLSLTNNNWNMMFKNGVNIEKQINKD